MAYGWRYAFRDFTSETFPDRESALGDLVSRFPAAAPYAEYLLFLEPLGEAVRGPTPVDGERAAHGPRRFSVRV